MRDISYYTSIIIISWLSLVVLSILVWENNRLTRKEKTLFYLTYALVALAALMEWMGILFNGDTAIPTWLLRTVKCADYILTPIAGAALMTNIKTDSIWEKLIRGLLVVNTLFQLVSAFTGWMITIDDQNHYSHGLLYPVYMALYILLIVMIAIEFITYSKNFRRQNKTSLYAILTLVLICILVQEILGSEFRTAYLGMTIGMIMMFIYITEFSQLSSDDTMMEQRIAITTDALTGVSSRYAYVAALKELDAKEALPAELTVFSVDINGLKQVNDTLGHAAGDELICGAAECVDSIFAANGTCYRTGGDEFIVLAEMDKDQAQEAMTKLKQSAAAWHGEMVGELYLAAGVAHTADYPELSVEKLIIKADMAMYEEKDAFYRRTRMADGRT